ncbi:hypothetical protein E4U54_007058, partial [Claviceps lovelessii]
MPMAGWVYPGSLEDPHSRPQWRSRFADWTRRVRTRHRGHGRMGVVESSGMELGWSWD